MKTRNTVHSECVTRSPPRQSPCIMEALGMKRHQCLGSLLSLSNLWLLLLKFVLFSDTLWRKRNSGFHTHLLGAIEIYEPFSYQGKGCEGWILISQKNKFSEINSHIAHEVFWGYWYDSMQCEVNTSLLFSVKKIIFAQAEWMHESILFGAKKILVTP